MPQLVHSTYIRWWDRFASSIQIPNFALPSLPSALSPLSPSLAAFPPPSLSQTPPSSLQEQIQKQENKGKAPMVSEPNFDVSSQSPPFTPPERFYSHHFAILEDIQAKDDLLDTPLFEDSQDPYDYSPLNLDEILPLPAARPLIFKAPPVVPTIVFPTAVPTVVPFVAPPSGGSSGSGPPLVSNDITPAVGPC